MSLRTEVYQNYIQLSEQVAGAMTETLARRLQHQEQCSLVLTGGSTPRKLYELFATSYQSDVEWERVHIFVGDERLVPLNDVRSNFYMIQRFMLQYLNIPESNIHPVHTEEGSPAEIARTYDRELQRYWEGSTNQFDLVLLGLGEDGHIASIFPGAETTRVTDRYVVPVTDSPKPPPNRISLTFPALNSTRQLYFIVSGEAKAGAVYRSIESDLSPEECPAKGIDTNSVDVVWYIDKTAASELKHS